MYELIAEAFGAYIIYSGGVIKTTDYIHKPMARLELIAAEEVLLEPSPITGSRRYMRYQLT